MHRKLSIWIFFSLGQLSTLSFYEWCLTAMADNCVSMTHSAVGFRISAFKGS